MTTAEQMRAEAHERVSAWPSLTAEQQAELTVMTASKPVITDCGSGGAFLTVNGVDRWFPSRHHARAELAARELP